MIYLITLSRWDAPREMIQMLLPRGTQVIAVDKNNPMPRPAAIENVRPTQDLILAFGQNWAVIRIQKTSEQFKIQAELKANGIGFHVRPSTIALSEPEAAAVRALMESQDLSETAVFRQALRMYQAVRLGAAELTWKMNPTHPDE